MRNKRIILVGILAMAVLIGAANVWGFIYFYNDTPEYSLRVVCQAVKNQNWQDFDRHVDTDKVVYDFIDDLHEFHTRKREIDYGCTKVKDMTVPDGFQLMRENIAAEVRGDIRQSIDEGALKKYKHVYHNEENAYDIMKEFMRIESIDMLDELSFNGVDYVKYDNKNNRIAEAGIKVHNDELDKSYIIKLTMVKVRTGCWKIVSIANLSNYLADVDRVREEARIRWTQRQKI